jgi:hypothetical protein
MKPAAHCSSSVPLSDHSGRIPAGPDLRYRLAPPVWSELLQRTHRRIGRSGASRARIDLLERCGRPGVTRSAGTRGPAECDRRTCAHALSTTGCLDDQPGTGSGRHHLAGRAGRRAFGVGGAVAAQRILASAGRGPTASGRGPADRDAVPPRGVAIRPMALSSGQAGGPSRRSFARRELARNCIHASTISETATRQRLAEVAPFPLASAPPIRRMFSE